MTQVTTHDPLRAGFEKEFHSRTLAYLPEFADDGRAVVVKLGDGAHTAAGHALAHGLVNLLARAHQSIVIVGDIHRALLCRSLFVCSTVEEATVGLARDINPYVDIQTGAEPDAHDTLITLGIGSAGTDYDLGADRWVAHVGDGTITDLPTSIIGACLAACLGSFIAFNALTGRGLMTKRSFSAWDYLATPDGQGPDLSGPLDVGSLLCAGGGAVASALSFFAALHPNGIAGDWVIVDGDLVDVSNLNRQMAFIAADAGWAGADQVNKAISIAHRLGQVTKPSPHWYDESPAKNARYDVVLALANERDVRAALANTQPTVLLHATTSPSWQAQIHRHIAGQDDCLNCRLPGEPPVLKCSTAQVGTGDKKADAALPFLSATAGLMLLVALARLQARLLLDAPHNYVAVDFDGSEPRVSGHVEACRSTCRTRLERVARQRIDAASRWAHLDKAGQS